FLSAITSILGKLF
uniref:Temporin-1SPc n=1 Tax=Lithobates septentrionalis TaxID=190274 RepID=TP1C_LITST|nr:RecName: Full=Temporin-1SPc [Lithobates septentrionalis]